MPRLEKYDRSIDIEIQVRIFEFFFLLVTYIRETVSLQVYERSRNVNLSQFGRLVRAYTSKRFAITN